MNLLRSFISNLFLITALSLFPFLGVTAQEVIDFEMVGEISDTDNNFLGSPTDIIVIDDRVFIADQLDLKIKIFSTEGNYIGEMGKRGRGPGELLHFTAMWNSHNDKIIHVADYFNQKIVNFSIDGTFIDENNLREGKIIWPRTFHQLSDSEILIIYQSLSNKNEIFHVWGNNFENFKYSFTLPDELINNDKYHENHLSLYPGSSIISNSKLYYAPPFYKGKIYYKNLSTKTEWNSINGVSISENAYEKLSDNDRLKNVSGEQIYDHRILNAGEKFIYRLYNTTKALFLTNEGYIAHFVEVKIGDEKHQGIELYESSGKYIGFHSYLNKNISDDRYTMILEYPKAIDSKNRVYIINRSGQAPVISIYQLKIHQ